MTRKPVASIKTLDLRRSCSSANQTQAIREDTNCAIHPCLTRSARIIYGDNRKLSFVNFKLMPHRCIVTRYDRRQLKNWLIQRENQGNNELKCEVNGTVFASVRLTSVSRETRPNTKGQFIRWGRRVTHATLQPPLWLEPVQKSQRVSLERRETPDPEAVKRRRNAESKRVAAVSEIHKLRLDLGRTRRSTPVGQSMYVAALRRFLVMLTYTCTRSYTHTHTSREGWNYFPR